MKPEVEARLKKVCQTINASQWGGDQHDALLYLGAQALQSIEKFSSGCSRLDEALGGGWPRGRIIEIFGPESGGKSTLCLHSICEFQKKYPDEDVAIIDSEFSFDPEYAKRIGLITDSILVHQPSSGEQALNVLELMIHSGVKLIIVDSVAALTPQVELDGQIGDSHMAVQARMMSQAMRKLTAIIGKSNACVMFTNQMRDKIGVMWGEKTTTPGGRALRFYSSIRAEITRIGSNKEADVAVSNKVKVTVKKNKVAPPFRTAEFTISFGYGIDQVAALVDDALAKKVIKKSGAWMSLEGENIAQGRPALINLLRVDETVRDKVKDLCSNAINMPETEEEQPVTRKARKSSKKKSGGDQLIDVNSLADGDSSEEEIVIDNSDEQEVEVSEE